MFSPKGFEQKQNGTVKMYEKEKKKKNTKITNQIVDRHKNFVISHIQIEWDNKSQFTQHNENGMCNAQCISVMISRRSDMTAASLSFHGLEKKPYFFCSFRVRFVNHRRIPWWITPKLRTSCHVVHMCNDILKSIMFSIIFMMQICQPCAKCPMLNAQCPCKYRWFSIKSNREMILYKK